MNCPGCGSTELMLNGRKSGVQRYQCKNCGKYFQEGKDYSNTPARISKVSKPNKTKMGISKEALIAKYDVNFIMSQVIKKFEDNMFYEKSDIIQMSGLRPGYPGMNVVLESGTFKNYSGRAGGKTYYAKSELIEEMKNEGILS